MHLALTGWLSTERDWHQDDHLNPPFINTWYATVWIAFDTVTPEPCEYAPGSRRWPLLRGEKVRRFLTEVRGEPAAMSGNGWPGADCLLSVAKHEKQTYVRLRGPAAIDLGFSSERPIGGRTVIQTSAVGSTGLRRHGHL